MNFRIPLLLLTLLLLSLSAQSQECDEFSVSFMVDGKNKWEGLSIEEIQKREPNMRFRIPGKNQTEGLALKHLVNPYAKNGTLIVYACDGGNESFEVAQLLSDNSDDSGYFLTLSKRNFFKLMKAGKPKPLLKKVYQLKLVP